MVALHCCVTFCWTAKWVSYMYTYIPSFLDFLPRQATSEHWAEFPELCRRFSLWWFSHSVMSNSCDPTDFSLPGSVRRILQARILEWLSFPSPGDLPDPGTEPWPPALQGDSLLSEPPGKPPWGYQVWTQSQSKQVSFYFLSVNFSFNLCIFLLFIPNHYTIRFACFQNLYKGCICINVSVYTLHIYHLKVTI